MLQPSGTATRAVWQPLLPVKNALCGAGVSVSYKRRGACLRGRAEGVGGLARRLVLLQILRN